MNFQQLTVYTARVSYSGTDRLNVTRKSAPCEGLPFAPSWASVRPVLDARRDGASLPPHVWERYVAAYTEEMRRSYRAHRAAWDALLARQEVTLCCYCTNAGHCHRTLLAAILVKLGAIYRGER